MEFRWASLPEGLLSCLAEFPEPSADNRADAAQAARKLSDGIGETPTDERARELWRLMRDGWILGDPARVERVAGLLDSLQVGRAAREAAADDADFLRTVRASAGLRHAVIRYLVALGSGAGAAGDPVEIAAAPDRVVALRPSSVEPVSADAPIQSSDFAPRSSADFSRLAGMNDLQWGLFMLNLFNAAERLLPGETLVVRTLVDDVANDGQNQGLLGVSIAHDVGGNVMIALVPEPRLPAGTSYERLRPALSDLGWEVTGAGLVFAQFPWADGLDDAIAVIVQTLRGVFLIDSPARLQQSDEIRPPEGTLPAPPGPTEVVQPEGPVELLAVVAAVIRAAGGTVLTGADPLTFAIRIGAWSGWIHADEHAPLLDAVFVVADLGSEGSDSTRTGSWRCSPAGSGSDASC